MAESWEPRMLALEREVDGMKTDFKDGVAELKQANGTLTELKVVTEEMIKSYEKRRVDETAENIEMRKDNKERDEKITKNSQVVGWLAKAVGAIGLLTFGIIVKYILEK